MQQVTPETDAGLAARLRLVPLLRGLDAANLARLARAAKLREHAPGTIIFMEGDPPPALYVVESGWVKIAKTARDGREQTLYFLGPGEIFGGVFVNRPVPASAIALETTRVLELSREPVRQMIAETPALALSMIEFMAERVTGLVELVADLSLHTLTARLARLLVEQAEGQVVHRQRWATQAELASRLGTVPDVLSRAMRDLVESGVIEVTRQEIRLLQPQVLRAKFEPAGS